MVKHVVMWKFKEEAEGNTKACNLKIFKDGLEALCGIIPQIKTLEVAINQVESPASYDIVLISTFENMEDLAIYSNHPEHVKVANFCALVRESRVVVDWEI